MKPSASSFLDTLAGASDQSVLSRMPVYSHPQSRPDARTGDAPIDCRQVSHQPLSMKQEERPVNVKPAKDPVEEQPERLDEAHVQSGSDEASDPQKDGRVVSRAQTIKNSASQIVVASQPEASFQFVAPTLSIPMDAMPCEQSALPKSGVNSRNEDVQPVPATLLPPTSFSAKVEDLQPESAIQDTGHNFEVQLQSDVPGQCRDSNPGPDQRAAADPVVRPLEPRSRNAADGIQQFGDAINSPDSAQRYVQTPLQIAMGDYQAEPVEARRENAAPAIGRTGSEFSYRFPQVSTLTPATACESTGKELSVPAIQSDSDDSQATSQHGRRSQSDPMLATQSGAGKTAGSPAQFSTFAMPPVSSQAGEAGTTSAVFNGDAHFIERRSNLSGEALQDRQAGAGSSGIQVARIVQSMSDSEMRVGMRSAEFGEISIRTSVMQQQLQARISVDHGELRSAIAAHIPAIQSKLGNENGIHASIEVSQMGLNSPNDGNQSSRRERREFGNSSQSPESRIEFQAGPVVKVPPPVSSMSEYRLDIRA